MIRSGTESQLSSGSAAAHYKAPKVQLEGEDTELEPEDTDFNADEVDDTSTPGQTPITPRKLGPMGISQEYLATSRGGGVDNRKIDHSPRKKVPKHQRSSEISLTIRAYHARFARKFCTSPRTSTHQ